MTAAPGERTNEQWLTQLRDAKDASGALESLRSYVRGALARVLHNRPNVQDTDLDDFTQEALARVLERLDTFRGDSKLTTWATAVAVRVALSTLRQRRYDDRPLEELQLGHLQAAGGADTIEFEPGDAMDRRAMLGALHTAIQNDLTDRQRTVILGELAGATTATLVEQLGTNPNALYKLYHDARQKLKKSLEAAGFGEEAVRSQIQGASRDT